jgi:hypothetical protein
LYPKFFAISFETHPSFTILIILEKRLYGKFQDDIQKQSSNQIITRLHLPLEIFSSMLKFSPLPWLGRIGVIKMPNEAPLIYMNILHMRGCDQGSQLLGRTSSLRMDDLRGLFTLLYGFLS